jgi:hypothetical protein
LSIRARGDATGATAAPLRGRDGRAIAEGRRACCEASSPAPPISEARRAKAVVAMFDEPDSARDVSADSAAWFFVKRQVGEPADGDDIVKVRKLINGGDKGLEEVKKYYETAKTFPGLGTK